MAKPRRWPVAVEFGLRGARCPAHGGMLRSSLSANSCNVAPCARRLAAYFCWAGVREGRHVLSLGLGAASAFGGTGADKIALHVGEAAENRQHQAPGAGAGVGPRLGQGSKLRALASTMRLTMPNRSNVLRASRSMRVTVTTSPGWRRSSMRRSSRRSARAPVTFSR